MAKVDSLVVRQERKVRSPDVPTASAPLLGVSCRLEQLIQVPYRGYTWASCIGSSYQLPVIIA